MSKKWMAIAGVLVLGVALILAALLLTSHKTSSPNTPNSGTPSTATSSTTSSTTGTETTQGQNATSEPGTGTTHPSLTTTSGTSTSSPNTNLAAGPLKPFPPLPDPHLPAQSRTSPAASGQKLAPLTEAPKGTMSGLALSELFSSAQYSIVMRPYGIGPSSAFGSRLVIRVDSAKPLGVSPVYKRIVNANILVLANTKSGGTVTKGGTYKATLTFLSDGTKLLPILTGAKVTK